MPAKVPWCGRLFSVQPRIRLARSYDERSHSYLGFVLGVHGTVGDEDDTRDFHVALGKAAQKKHAFTVGDEVSGLALPVPDPRKEPAEFYKVSKLKVVERTVNAIHKPPPWHDVTPELPVYQARGHRRLGARAYKDTCSSCMWACRMPVELIRDHWKPTVGVRWRFETFCYGPKSCRFYKAGPKRKTRGRRDTHVEEDWVDESDTSCREPDE